MGRVRSPVGGVRAPVGRVRASLGIDNNAVVLDWETLFADSSLVVHLHLLQGFWAPRPVSCNLITSEKRLTPLF